ncbi:MAG: class I SAM-dependent methyltransferase [Verrucomicrobiia bacterium]
MEGRLAFLVNEQLPCVLFEDDSLLVVNKPTGWNTHSPAPFAGEGIYDWLRNREPRWNSLAIIHRLDKETSGVLVFSKNTIANRSLTSQFTNRAVQKKYLLLTDRHVPEGTIAARSSLVRVGVRYVSRPEGSRNAAETSFRLVQRDQQGRSIVEALPMTGRTHQIRVHASDHGFPILGDTLYGGTPWQRACLHAAELELEHPATGRKISFVAAPDFEIDPAMALRRALISPDLTDCYRLAQGASDGWPGWYLDRLALFMLASSADPDLAGGARRADVERWMRSYGLVGACHKRLVRSPGKGDPADAAPKLVIGHPPPDPLVIRENGIRFALSLKEGYSVGLFLDQRENRRRLLTGHVGTDFALWTTGAQQAEVLNTFAYTCAFSVCAAAAGARTTSLDLSRRYLDWGRRNFELNGLELGAHDFVFGEAFDWMRRFAKKSRQFDLVILDPPTFSRSKGGVFQVEKDYSALVDLALPLLKPEGVLLASTNAAGLEPERFLRMVHEPIQRARWQIVQEQYVPQPPDFPISRAEPAYLKTVWMRLRSAKGRAGPPGRPLGIVNS